MRCSPRRFVVPLVVATAALIAVSTEAGSAATPSAATTSAALAEPKRERVKDYPTREECEAAGKAGVRARKWKDPVCWAYWSTGYWSLIVTRL
ncbi:hypothetical protein ACFRR7_15420 [Streptomyces sp. NPDC056909]|uniref:hypothetical protein n=1 Tax=unclassified Streptomyces TaxID=2593676 RepID=UPI0036CFE241